MGNWYPSAHGPNTGGGQHIYITFDKQFDVTDPSYFTNLGGKSGIRIEKEGYYHVELVTLVYLGCTGDYGHVYLRTSSGYPYLDLEHAHGAYGAGWDDRHNSWKGWLDAGEVISAHVYHHCATPYYYHNGPLYTRLTIEKLN